MKNRFHLTASITLLCFALAAISCKKVTPEERISQIFNYFQNDTLSTNLLKEVTASFPARLSGSENNDNAVDYFTLILGKEIKPDNLWTQEVRVPHWESGESKVECRPSKGEPFEIPCVALGLSEGSDGKEIEAQVVEITSMEEYEKLKKGALKGKIAFFNEPMEKGGYGKAGWQRRSGAELAAQKGAVAVLVRSLTDEKSDDPHTGVTNYADSVDKIPALAISTNGADLLSDRLKRDKRLKVALSSTAKRLPDAIGRNLVAEIKGSQNPDQIILLSAHLDCWHNSQGAHDNAASCVTAVETLRAFKNLKIKPKNTIRILLYQDEETGLSGMKEYARIAKEKGETYLFNMEMDSGAGGPKSFMVSEPKPIAEKIKEIVMKYLGDYGVEDVSTISRNSWPLTQEVEAPYYLYRANTENYFRYHHSSADNFDTIDPVAFKKGIAAIASFVFIMD